MTDDVPQCPLCNRFASTVTPAIAHCKYLQCDVLTFRLDRPEPETSLVQSGLGETYAGP